MNSGTIDRGTLEKVVRQLNEQILDMLKAELPTFDAPRQSAEGNHAKAASLKRHLPSFPLPQAVVARIDEWSRTKEPHLPLVIAVGINHGGVGAGNQSIDEREVYADLKIRARLEEAFDLATPKDTKRHAIPKPDSYHLVAVYLFPWLAVKPWIELGLPDSDETLFIDAYGYSDPLVAVNKLIKLIRKGSHISCVPWVVFHGSSPVVKKSAIDFIAQQAPYFPDIPDVLLCDDLTGSAPIDNSTILALPLLGKEHLYPGPDVDE